MPGDGISVEDSAAVARVVDATSKGKHIGAVFEEIQKELRTNPNINRDNLMKGLSTKLLEKFPPDPLTKKVDELKHDKDVLEENFDFIEDGNNVGKEILDSNELTNFKLTGTKSDGKESPAYSPEELDSIARLAFNPQLQGLDGKEGLSIADVEKAISIEEAKKAATGATAPTDTPTPPTPAASVPAPSVGATAQPAKSNDTPAPPAAGTAAEIPKPAMPPSPAQPPKTNDTPAPPAAGTAAEIPKPAMPPSPAQPPKTNDTPAPPLPAELPPVSTDTPAAPAASPGFAVLKFNYGNKELSVLKPNSSSTDISSMQLGNSILDKDANGKWIDNKTKSEVPGKFSFLPDFTLRTDLRKDVYTTVSPVDAQGASTRTVHRSDKTEASALYKDGAKEPHAIVESANGQKTTWLRDTTDGRIWKNGDQTRYYMSLEENGNLEYTMYGQQSGQPERHVVTNNGVDLHQGQDNLGQDGLPRYTFDGSGRITMKEYAGGNRQNAFRFTYNNDGSDQPVNVAYEIRHWTPVNGDPVKGKHEVDQTMSYALVTGDTWKVSKDGAVLGTLIFKPLLSPDGRFSTQHVENGVWVHTDHDQMTRSYLVANNPQYQAVYTRDGQPCQPTYSRTMQQQNNNNGSRCRIFCCRRQRRSG